MYPVDYVGDDIGLFRDMDFYRRLLKSIEAILFWGLINAELVKLNKNLGFC